jgi:hypothetical protein
MTGIRVPRNFGVQLERRYEAWRLQEQVVTAAYALLVPPLRRSVSSAPTGQDRWRGQAASASPRRVVGGSW